MTGSRPTLYFEDIEVGQRFVTPTALMEEAALKNFAGEFDPQPFHTDNEAAKNSLFKGLAASGWHTAALTMKLQVEHGPALAGGWIGAGGQISWPKPTRPGDTLYVESEILEKTPSRSRPDRGRIAMRWWTRNQNEEVVQEFVVNALILRRMDDGHKT